MKVAVQKYLIEGHEDAPICEVRGLQYYCISNDVVMHVSAACKI